MTLFYNRKSETPKRQALRRNIPEPEKILWRRLRHKQIRNIKFRRQYSVGPYVIDFYSPELRLGIEIDGDSHRWGDAPAYDRAREEFTIENGIRIIRFTNLEVLENIEGVLKKINTVIRAFSAPS
jgi:very-short-patch-repair endonuclease